MKKVKEVFTASTYLKGNTLYFARLFLDIPRSQFACHTTTQYHPQEKLLSIQPAEQLLKQKKKKDD